jgi:hypothetical protein
MTAATTAIAAPKISFDTFAMITFSIIDARKIGVLPANSNHASLSRNEKEQTTYAFAWHDGSPRISRAARAIAGEKKAANAALVFEDWIGPTSSQRTAHKTIKAHKNRENS